MDNATYDELNLTPISNDETYSRLRRTQDEVRPSDDLTRRADIDQNTTVTKGVKQTSTKEAPSNTKFKVITVTVLFTMIVILLLLTLTSIALSVATFSRLTSMQSKMMASQLDNQNEDKSRELNSTQLIQTQNNISQTLAQLDNRASDFIDNLDEDNLTQLIQIQKNISQILTQLDDRVNDFISTQLNPQSQSQCGTGLWWRVAYLNMTEPLQQCPSAWREYNTSGVRACGRKDSSTGSCAAEFYCTNRQYSRVCGKIIGYQFESTDAFRRLTDFDGRGLDGVIISHGEQQDHIWSFVAGLTEENSAKSDSKCPCSSVPGTGSPMDIGDKYFCESGNPNDRFEEGRLYSSDPLWDGQQCDSEGSCCGGTQSPPWFSVQLPAPTTDMIEVSICCDQETEDEDTPVELIEIYVQ